MAEQERIWFCDVEIKGFQKTELFMCLEGRLEPGTFVMVPFGKDCDPVAGMVMRCECFNADDAPNPPEETRVVLRTASAEEYAAQKPLRQKGLDGAVESGDDIGIGLERTGMDSTYEGSVYEQELRQVDFFIEEEDWRSVMFWALKNHETEIPAVGRKVMECYRLCMENDPDNTAAALNLGTFYYTGRFVKQNYVKAFELYRQSAEQGELRAICNCGYCFYYGRHQAVDYEKAHSYFSLGAVLYGDPNCLYKLGDMYLNGYHVAKNEIYALMLYRRAYATARCTKEHDCMADIQLRLGRCFLRGIGMPRDVLKAHKFLQKALNGFFARSRKDPFALGLVRDTRELITEAEQILEQRILDQMKGREEEPD